LDYQKQIQFDSNDLAIDLYGSQNRHLKRLQDLTHVQIHVRGNVATLSGAKENVMKAGQALESLYAMLARGNSIQIRDIDAAVEILNQGGAPALEEVFKDTISVNGQGRVIGPKSIAQQEYIQAIRNHDLVFGIGPAGTGKTYLAIAMAVEAFQEKRIRKIVLTRPAVEAGEKLGFLPGNLSEKVDPYLRPIFDALREMMDVEKVQRLLEKGDIEVAPLAYMRGRTLNQSFVILDEAQNTKHEQMKMFLTRMGQETQTVINGDVTQIDLPAGVTSGLIEAEGLLRGIPGIHFSYLTEVDVVRHPLVKKILKAYAGRKK
jgi:phosphate starvation-inducible PhoH-like protein